jgi:NADH-quinone oxidoreductase subunit L
MTISEHAWLLAAIPAGMFFLLALFGRYLPRGGDFLGVLATGSSFVLMFWVTAHYVQNRGGLAGAFGSIGEEAAEHPAWVNDIEWSTVGDFALRFGIYVDPIAIVMMAVVTSVALMVNIFSIGYMKGEPRYWWFFAVLQLFAASMLMLVLADNLLLLLISWELVGVCSFLLVGFYWERRSATEAAKKAFITTRIGDVGLFIAVILLWRATGTFNIQGIIHAAEEGEIGETYLIVSMLFLFLGAMGKSAQVPFHVWLPDAMEGPTPVSALIHAATMVVAGVYLVARMLPVFEVADGTMLTITIVGLVTALLTGFMALAQTDIKKVLAYSTVGQLGFMFVALGCGAPQAAMFHLMTHAFFKALLFLGSGSVIHATHHHQEMGELGGLWRKMPITGTTFLVGSLALAGVVPLAGFWSKDEILHATEHWDGGWALVLLAIAAVVTAFYSTRLFIRTFLGQPKDHHIYEHTHESGFLMTGPLIFLAVLSAVSGFVIFHDVGKAIGFPGGITEFIFVHEPHHFEIDWALFLLSVGIAAVGIGTGAWFYWNGSLARSTQLAESRPRLYALIKNKFYFDEIYQFGIDRLVLGFSFLVSWFDRYIVNDTGVDGSAQVTNYTGHVLRYVQTGKLPNYALGVVAGVIMLAILGLALRL